MPDTPLDGDPGEPPAFRSLATPRPKSAAPLTADTAPASERREPSFGRGSGGEAPPPDGGEGGRIEPSLGAPPPSDAPQEKTADAGPDSDDGEPPDDRDPEDGGDDTDDDRR
jgi:hypothetical protein